MQLKHQMAIVAVLLAATAAKAQFIDFESVPGSPSAVEGMAISNQFAVPFGVTFSLEGGGFPLIVEVGGTNLASAAGFLGPGPQGQFNGLPDTPAPNQRVGRYFLGNANVTNGVGAIPKPLLITYASPVRAASGVIIDIDCSLSNRMGDCERWLIEAQGTNGTTLTNVVLKADNPNPSPNTDDGRAAPWSFSRASNEIFSVRISYVGVKSNGVGLAFDNFATTSSVAPASLSITVTQRVARVDIAGSFGVGYRIEHTDSLYSPAWHSVTNLVLTNSPQQFILDAIPTNEMRRFYRAVRQ